MAVPYIRGAAIALTSRDRAIQLLKFISGPAKRSEEIRFRVYDHRGRFQRMPCII
jgi:hypothetical protein